ncbi:hypothetical protein AMK16_29380 [Streptomyces sp. CB00455]|nr:hypothetical protein AMK16_29380 [Streptomyces sp. CB00455]
MLEEICFAPPGHRRAGRHAGRRPGLLEPSWLFGQPMSSSGWVLRAASGRRAEGRVGVVWAAGVQDARDAHTDGLIVDSRALRTRKEQGAGRGQGRVLESLPRPRGGTLEERMTCA